MHGSLDRIRKVINFQQPERQPLFDLLPNDAVLAHFNGGVPVEIGDDRAGAKALAAAIDGSRLSRLSPAAEADEILPDGRRQKRERWTEWLEKRSYSSSEEYAEVKKRELAEHWRLLEQPLDLSRNHGYLQQCETKSWFGDDFYYLLACPHVGLMNVWSEVGLELFSYYLYDCEAVIVEQLDWNTEYACRWIESLPDDDPFEAVFIGDDVAFKTGPMFQVKWFERNYFPRLARLIAVLHGKGKKAMFHSDGNLNSIMDGLVEAGIDLLNPVERMASMDLADLHRRYPKLVFAGGIDVSHLLPFGTPQQVRDAVVKAIEDTEGQILVGSSTEVFNTVPLQNFLAMREAAMGFRW